MQTAARKPVALFVRVSTALQSNDRQISELTEYAESQNLQVVEVIEETISGAKQNTDRPKIKELLKLAKTGKIEKLVLHEVTRLGRDTAEVLAVLKALHDLKISVVVMSQRLETLRPDGSLDPTANLLFTLLSSLGTMERTTLIERIHSGIAEARRKGKVLGRPVGSTSDILKKHRKVVNYLKAGNSIRETAKLASVNPSTVQRVKRAMAA